MSNLRVTISTGEGLEPITAVLPWEGKSVEDISPFMGLMKYNLSLENIFALCERHESGTAALPGAEGIKLNFSLSDDPPDGRSMSQLVEGAAVAANSSEVRDQLYRTFAAIEVIYGDYEPLTQGFKTEIDMTRERASELLSKMGATPKWVEHKGYNQHSLLVRKDSEFFAAGAAISSEQMAKHGALIHSSYFLETLVNCGPERQDKGRFPTQGLSLIQDATRPGCVPVELFLEIAPQTKDMSLRVEERRAEKQRMHSKVG